MVQYSESREDLKYEAKVLSRYLVHNDLDDELVHRYVLACESRLPDAAKRSGANAVALSVKYPILLPSLDAISAFLRPKSLLRDKLLIMTAILETTPKYAIKFLPEFCTLPRLISRGMVCGLSVACKLFCGLFLFLVLRGKI